MGWLNWGIPLVGLAVWILSNLIKNQQDEARRRDLRAKPPGEEPQRREPPPVPRQVERPRPVERPRAVARPQPAPVQDRARPRPERAPQPEPARVVRRQAMADQIVVGQLVVPAAVVSSPAATVSLNRKPTKAIQNLHALLKSQNTLATAFLLTEVIGKPMCKKR